MLKNRIKINRSESVPGDLCLMTFSEREVLRGRLHHKETTGKKLTARKLWQEEGHCEYSWPESLRYHGTRGVMCWSVICGRRMCGTLRTTVSTDMTLALLEETWLREVTINYQSGIGLVKARCGTAKSHEGDPHGKGSHYDANWGVQLVGDQAQDDSNSFLVCFCFLLFFLMILIRNRDVPTLLSSPWTRSTWTMQTKQSPVSVWPSSSRFCLIYILTYL